MFPQSYKFYRGLCLNNLLQVWLIFNQRDQVRMFRHINQYNGVSRLVKGCKFLGDMKHLMIPVKRSVEAVGVCTEDNRDMKRFN